VNLTYLADQGVDHALELVPRDAATEPLMG
jgi:hypothetical protein